MFLTSRIYFGRGKVIHNYTYKIVKKKNVQCTIIKRLKFDFFKTFRERRRGRTTQTSPAGFGTDSHNQSQKFQTG